MEKPPAQPPKKFAPRAGVQRKTKAEREQYAREEEARLQQRTLEAARNGALGAANAASEGRSRGRGRGGSAVALNASDRTRGESGGGVFGAAVVGAGPGRVKGGSVKGEGLAEVVADLTGIGEGKESALAPATDVGDGEKKTTTTTTTSKKGVGLVGPSGKSDQPLYVESDEEIEEVATRDIERIWISSGDDDEDPGAIGRKGKQRAGQVARAGMGLRPVRAPRYVRDGEGPGTDRSGRPAGTSDEMDIDEQFTTDGPSSPEMKKGRRRATKPKESKAPTETADERAERLRYNEDVCKLREEFGGLPPTTSATTGGLASSAMDLDPAPSDARDGKLYLFQFPPLTPFLVDATGHYEVNEALEDPGVTPADTTTKVRGKDGGSDVKKEDDGEDSKANIYTEVPGALTAKSIRLPSGLVGKLHVHKSGKVSLDWGGADLEVRYGNEVDFLQDAVLVGGEGARTSWALGQVQKKLVVIPDWQKLYD